MRRFLKPSKWHGLKNEASIITTTPLPLENEQATRQLAVAIAEILKPQDCLCLSGTLGAGKTTFMRHLIHALGYEGHVISPTFMLVQDYSVRLPKPESETTTSLYHLDLYRIEHPDELEEVGLNDMLSNGIVCIEWPEIAADWLPNDAITLTIESNKEHRQAQLMCPARQDELERAQQIFYGKIT